MNGFIVFVKKEFTESLRTYKLVIMLAAFALLGIMGPMAAKMLPEILGSMNLEGMTITLPEPTAMDAWAQFFKNVGQMGMLCVVIIFSGLMANEFSRGTLVNLLTKGLHRRTVILSKFTAASGTWTLAYVLCLCITFAYIAYFWKIDIDNALLAFGGLWLFGEFLIALLIFGGTVFATFYGSLSVAGVVVVVLMIAGIAPQMAKYNPLSLSGGTLALLASEQSASDFMPTIIITTLSIIALLTASVGVFAKKKL